MLIGRLREMNCRFAGETLQGWALCRDSQAFSPLKNKSFCGQSVD